MIECSCTLQWTTVSASRRCLVGEQRFSRRRAQPAHLMGVAPVTKYTLTMHPSDPIAIHGTIRLAVDRVRPSPGPSPSPASLTGFSVIVRYGRRMVRSCYTRKGRLHRHLGDGSAYACSDLPLTTPLWIDCECSLEHNPRAG